MPLSEFFKPLRGNRGSDQQKPSSTDLPSRSEDDVVELVCEDGRIMMQGQSSRAVGNPARDTLDTSKTIHDTDMENAGASMNGKFGEVESMLDDMSAVVPSGQLDLSQNDEMVPMLSYPVYDALPPDFCSELLSFQTSFQSGDRRSTGNQTITYLQTDGGNVFKLSPSARLLCPGSGVTEMISNAASKYPDDDILGSSSQDRNMENDSTSMNIARQNIAASSESPSLLNFSHFSKALINANPVKATNVEWLNRTKEIFPAERALNLCEETSIKNDKPLSLSNPSDVERNLPPMIGCSSSGSGNSADIAASAPVRNSKRKLCNIMESECPGDDMKIDHVGLTKSAPAQRDTEPKRSRAAEVHNLSEKRRRERINEKMRALQELIPNCNKSDKASMLDEAIEYLKTLQLQVQIMSSAELCVPPPMMFAPGIHCMNPTQTPNFSPVGPGTGLDMGFRMCPFYPVPPLQAAYFSSPGPSNFPRIPRSNYPVYGHPIPPAGFNFPVPKMPLVPLPRRPPITSCMGSSTSQMMGSEFPLTNKSTHSLNNAEASSRIRSSSQLQATNHEVLDESAAIQENFPIFKQTDISKGDGLD